MRRAAKVDANQAAIVGALRACGAQVLSLAAIGKGCPDLLILHRGRYQLLEVKNLKGKNHMYPAQEEFHRDWLVTTVETVEGAIAALRISGGEKNQHPLADGAGPPSGGNHRA